MSTLQEIKKLQANVSQQIIGQDQLVNRILMGLLANGNLLLEGLPGLAKTRAVKTLAKYLDTGLSRIQFTPDLLPADITGTEIYQPESAEKFIFQRGPIFSNLILADEINRAPAKVQSALLEAMEERQVTVAGKTYKMPEPFMVLATQNPIEQEGTYPLPEAQMDRFIMHVKIDYPTPESEMAIMELVRSEEGNHAAKSSIEKTAVENVFQARTEIQQIKVSANIDKYIADLVHCTRYPDKYSEELSKWIEYGASPRGALSLDKCSRVNAWLNGNDFVSPDDVRAVFHDVIRHRLILGYEASAKSITKEQVMDEVLKVVAVL